MVASGDVGSGGIRRGRVLGGAKGEPRPSTSGQGLREAGGGSREAGFRADRYCAAESETAGSGQAAGVIHGGKAVPTGRGPRLERIAGFASSPELAAETAKLAEDSAPRVVFQAVLTLGAFHEGDSLRTLAAIASRHVEDRWFRAAVLSSRAASSPELVGALGAEFCARGTAGVEKHVLRFQLVRKLPGSSQVYRYLRLYTYGVASFFR